METAKNIRTALEQVAALRHQAQAKAELAQAILAIKQLQSRRFAASYADCTVQQRHPYAPAVHFFLTELYSARDYTERDAQFARVAGAIERMLPEKVVALAEALARLHALSETLDFAMGQHWLALTANHTPGDLASSAETYIRAWRAVGRRSDRMAQLQIVQGIGRELARLTRLPGLRTMLRLMHGPARAAGLGKLQGFLEAGFDTFAQLARKPEGVAGFLDMIEEREGRLIAELFDDDAVAIGTHLRQLLGQAP